MSYKIRRIIYPYYKVLGRPQFGFFLPGPMDSWWTAAARLCQAIRDPAARLLATKRRVEAKQRCKVIVSARKIRLSKKARRQTV